ncbi:IS3 family transposase [Micromonospora matsumotoense]|uniref:IS3 family transposase n=1 Tax=Micromonospora matsumotoense TaxID=121616 RepID=UPI0033FD770A
MAKYADPDESADAGSEPERFAVRRMARLLEVSASGFYAWARRAAAPEPTPRQRRRAALAVRIRAIHAGSRGTYGSPRVTAELRARGERVSEKTVASVMAGIGIEGISPRTFKVRTTVPDSQAVFPPDLVGRRFDQGRLDAVWLTDVTYLTCGEGDMFWCAIRDGHSRRVLGHVVAERISAGMVAAAVDAAVACRAAEGRDVTGTVLHSDRGGEGGFNRSSQHLVGEVERWRTGRGKSRFGSIGVRSPRRDGRRWRGVRTGSSSGRRSVPV